jgi:AcrR family transcriptional regulator
VLSVAPMGAAGRHDQIVRTCKILVCRSNFHYLSCYINKLPHRLASPNGAPAESLHFYKTKEALAASVAEEVIDAVAADAEAALQGHDAEVAPAVRSLLTACSKWPQRFPHYRRLAGYVEADRRAANGPSARGLQVRLEVVLADWARRLIAVGRVVPLSSAQLYAVIIAPALCDTTAAVVPAPGKQEIEWIEFLASAALKVIAPQANPGGAPKRKADSTAEVRPKGQDDLFRRSPP